MAYTAQQLGLKAPSGGFQDNGWYDGRNYDSASGTFGEPNQAWSINNPGKRGSSISKEVVDQSGSANWSFIQQQSAIDANNINQPVSLNLPSGSGQSTSGLQSEVDTYRVQLDNVLKNQKAEADAKLAEMRKREQDTLDKVEELSTPFREDLENAERERLYVNKNFEENQKLVDELELLLNEGNDLIRQQQEVTGLASVRNPRIQQTMNDVQARAGVIEAVISARNGQIAQAENMIDRSINAITADKMDQLSYYNTVLSLANRDIIMLDAESKNVAQQQIDLIKGDMDRANATVDYVKQLLINPDTAAMMGSAGVKLTDSVDQINAKLKNAVYTQELRDQSNQISLQGGKIVLDPSGIPADQLVSFTDSRGETHYYKIPKTGGSATTTTTASSYLQQVQSGGTTASAVTQTSSQISSKPSDDGPNYSPSYVGATWVNPSTGSIWQYTSSGWRKVL